MSTLTQLKQALSPAHLTLLPALPFPTFPSSVGSCSGARAVQCSEHWAGLGVALWSRLAWPPGADICLGSIRPKLPDDVLTQKNSLVQSTNVLVLLHQVVKAEKLQFNSSGHAVTYISGLDVTIFPSVIYYLIWSKARVSQVRLSHPL